VISQEKDSFSELQKAYENLIEDLNELENVYDDQSSYHAKTVKVYHENEEQLDENYKILQKERNHLDQQLKTLQKYSDSHLLPEYLQLKSVNLINTLLLIAFFYLIYIIFMDL
jgi:predicted  nucleic acid-binding Zn-ribbon protein